MKSETPLDFAVFQLSPRRSRCELFVSGHGNTEKLASGLVKPFVTHLKVAEEQVALAVQTIKLEIEKDGNADAWFTKGTLERFVRFVSTPEILELVNTFDAEMSQLEAARRIYSQGEGDQHSGGLGGGGTVTGSTDETKKELLKAIDVRLAAARQDLVTASARASAAGFNPDTVADLQLFADQFGAHRLNEACSNFISFCRRRPDLINTWTPSVDDRAVRSSCGSDMSIDDPTEDHAGTYIKPQYQTHSKSRTEQHSHLDQSGSSTCQVAKSSATLSRQNVNLKDDTKVETLPETLEKNKSEEEASAESSSTPVGPPARRLSVQDRINLFENKQKENTSGSGGAKPVSGKPLELRRLSSDVSSAPSLVEKAVLRRWSGVSDMSIDFSSEKKDVESPSCTASSSSISETKSSVFSGAPENQSEKRLPDLESRTTHEKGGDTVGVGNDDLAQAELQNTIGVYPAKRAGVSKEVETDWKERTTSQDQVGSFPGGAEPGGLNDRGISQGSRKNFSSSDERNRGSKGNLGSETQVSGFADRSEIRDGNQVAYQIDVFAKKAGDDSSDGRLENKVDSSGPRDFSAYPVRARGSRSHSRSFSGQFEGGVGLKLETSSAQFMEVDGGQLSQQWRSLREEPEAVANKDLASDMQHLKVDDFGVKKMKPQKPDLTGRKQAEKSQGGRDQNNSIYERNKLDILGKNVLEGPESNPTISSKPGERVQRVRQSKGNQELNDELKMKANELERLFAEHKLRVPGEHSNSAKRSNAADMQLEQPINLRHRTPSALESTRAQVVEGLTKIESMGSSNKMEENYTTPTKMISNNEFGDDSRGKFYNKYMQKRDARLREECISKRAEKEAKMKAMHDSLEKSKAEMKAKFSGDRQDSVASARRRAEKLRSFNYRSRSKEQLTDLVQSEDDGDFPEDLEQKFNGNDRLHSDSYTSDGASRNNQNKKGLPSRNLSSTPRSSGVPAPRSLAKVSHSSSGKRRGQTENVLAQSVPNFSDLRKENTKPSGVSKTTIRPQVRNYVRSKTTSEEPVIKDEKPRRAQSLRKNSASTVEFKDIPPLNTDNVVLAPLILDKEQNEESVYDQYLKSLESKPFQRKGNGVGPGAGASIAKLKASMEFETSKDEEEFDEMAFGAEDSEIMTKQEEGEEEEEEHEKMDIKLANMDNGKLRLSQELEKSSNSGSENDDSLRSHSRSQVDHPTVSELPSMVPSFHKTGLLQDSPGESPLSWNSRLHHPFSYPHETSDIDAYMDSPIGSPASWNSHNITQAETDVARMRKKWGSAQKPSLVATSSSQSRKDMTKGFKRLLKFGRKSRGTESMVDWISATTSEGDDDTEDGRDPASRSSEDLRKSRMGFSQGPDDSFNESDLFCEQVQDLQSSIPAPPANFKLREDHMSGSSLKAPRSFFSLSTFRGKGSDAKSR